MANKPIKAILDTNLWISYLITDHYKFLDIYFLKEEVKILFSKELLDEIIEVTRRPKFKKYFTKQDVGKLLKLFDTYGIFIDIKIK